MTWVVHVDEHAIRVEDMTVGTLDLVHGVTGVAVRDLDPLGVPSHLAALLAAGISHRTGAPFQAVLLAVAPMSWAAACSHIEEVNP